MAQVKIKNEEDKSPILGKKQKTHKESKRLGVLDGFRFGFGFFIAFLLGNLIVLGLVMLMWWVVKLLGLSLF